MIRPRTLRLLVLAALVALLGASCSVGVGTAPEDFVAPDEQSGADRDGDGSGADVDLLADGAEEAMAELADAVGGERVRALELAFYPDSVYLEAQRPADPARVDVYNWNAGEGVSSGGEKDVSGIDLDARLFNVNQVNLAAIPELVAAAPDRLGIQGDITSSVIVQRPESSPMTLMTVFVSTPRGANGALIADQNGNIVATS